MYRGKKNQIIQNPNYYYDGDQKKYLKQDNRIINKNYFTAPFNCIGKIVSYFKIMAQKNEKIISLYGTGTLISPRVILTSAHNFYDHKYKVKAFKSIFYPSAQQKYDNQILEGISIQIFNLHPCYLDLNSKFRQRHDIALAALKQNKIIKQNQFLKIDWDYSFLNSSKDNIMVVGYSADHQSLNQIQNRAKNVLSFSLMEPVDHKQNFLYYKHTTDAGNSGGPVLYRKSEKEEYKIIAIHKGDIINSNYGILINDTPTPKKIFDQLVQKNNLANYLSQDCWPSYHKLKNDNSKLVQQNQYLKKRIEQLEKKQLLNKKNQFNNLNKEIKSNVQTIKNLKLNINQTSKNLIQRPQSFKQMTFFWQKSQKQNAQLKVNKQPTNYNIFQQKSKIIKSFQQIDFIVDCFKTKKIKLIKLLYRASYHNFQIKHFHYKCDYYSDTIMLCQTQYGKVFGGYTPLLWNQKKSIYGNSYYKLDKQNRSFIFSLTNKQKFHITDNQKQNKLQIYCDNNFGPTFGVGNDICIQDKADRNRKSFAKIGSTYVHYHYTSNCKQSLQNFSGSSDGYFGIKQWQVFRVQFQM